MDQQSNVVDGVGVREDGGGRGREGEGEALENLTEVIDVTRELPPPRHGELGSRGRVGEGEGEGEGERRGKGVREGEEEGEHTATRGATIKRDERK